MENITLDTIATRINDLALEGMSIIRTDKGNGSAGPMLISPFGLKGVEFDLVCKIEDVDYDDKEILIDACKTFDNDLSNFTHVAYESDANGWTGLYLIW